VEFRLVILAAELGHRNSQLANLGVGLTSGTQVAVVANTHNIKQMECFIVLLKFRPSKKQSAANNDSNPLSGMCHF
jgi:hypothetical protein